MNHTAIPSALKEVNNWVLWGERKIPYSVDGKPASTTNPETWSAFDDVMAEFLSPPAHIKGIGFVFTEASGFIGIDLDDAFTEDLEIKPWAQKVLALFGCGYAEISPSKRGLHLIVKGKKPGDKCRCTIESKAGTKLGELEMYSHARYFTMTGEVYGGFREIVEAQAQIDYLYTHAFKEEKAEGAGNNREEAAQPPQIPTENLSADQIIALIQASAQASKFSVLMNASFEDAVYEYDNDHSRAVYALSGIVAFYTPLFEVMDAIFRRSVLCTGKWMPPGGKGGKWARLGHSQFNRQRNINQAAGNVYSSTRATPMEDFGGVNGAKCPECPPKDPEAERDRHIALLGEMFTDVRRDLFSGSIHVLNGHKTWEPLWTKSIISAIKSECLARGKKYKRTHLDDHLYYHERTLEPRLLIDVPAWDGVDRIDAMCKRVSLTEVSQELFSQCYKDWCARMWAKILNPNVQNRCIILSGKQGIGKDIWVRSQFCALGKYLTELTLAGVHTKETEIAVVMGAAAVMFISEFDKTNLIGVSTLKDIITKPAFTFVRKYDRDGTVILNRCSVMGACNPEHVLRDVTGNRRFIVFKLKGDPRRAIRWDYPVDDMEYSAQIIAQCKTLCESGYCTTDDVEAEVKEVTERYTPDDPNEDIIVDFESAIEEKERFELHKQGIFNLTDIDDVLQNLARNHSMPRRTILSVLKAAGCQYRTHGGRHYGRRSTMRKAKEILYMRDNEHGIPDSAFD